MMLYILPKYSQIVLFEEHGETHLPVGWMTWCDFKILKERGYLSNPVWNSLDEFGLFVGLS
jgi:hemolysin-activating ACP:hemolysin acyltransferase